MTTFPTLRIGVLQSICELKDKFNANDTLFDGKDCPYDAETIAALRQIFKIKIVETTIEKIIEREVTGARGRPKVDSKLSEEDQQTVEESARELLDQLKTLGEGEKGLDTQTKIQIIKTKATLIEQILKIRERLFNVKRSSQFQTVVIGILDDLMDEDRRDAFMKRIEPYRE